MALNLNGISNENEFYTHHYLVTILENDLKNLFATWERQEEEQGLKPPHHLLNRLSREYFIIRGQMERAKSAEDILALQRRFLPDLLEALGYTMEPGSRTLDSGSPVPVIGEVLKKSGEPELWILEAVCSSTEATDVLDACLVKAQYSEAEGDKLPLDINFAELVTKQVFTLPEPPRWVVVVGFASIVLLDRSKWNEKRFLRFDLAEILGRKELTTFKAMAALLHRNSVCPDDGICLLDSLDENSHKHAFAVSDDLKYSAREAVELIGNEAVYYFREKYKGSVFGERGGDVLSEKQLTEECLRYLYRLLFLFYIEARPELGYAPMRSEEFRTGYSLESLRDLEMIPLTSEESQNGYYINDSLDNLFKLIFDGFNHGEAELALAFDDAPQHHTFRMQPLKCHLFDPVRTSLLGKVKFRNSVLQRVIQLLSVSRPGSGRRGRISYAQLGINQLGAVYEGLLSYSGFFAKTDLYEAKKADEQYNELEAAYFVTKEELPNYEDTEKVFNADGTLKMYPRGAFIYRLAGRNREKSASYYTPEVLTQCLVKYALKELLKDKSADDILQLTVCEPAMGSGAFLNEAINQLSEAYLQKKQKETGQIIGHDVYGQEKQKVKAYLADNNVYGVDLNPTAVELAEVSLWLNSICPGDGDNPSVPWFGNQLVTGNSLIGARRQVFSASHVEENRKGKQTWQDVVPERVPLGTDRPKKSVYHFLLPDPGMANYGDKVVKAMVPNEIAKIKEWQKSALKPFSTSQSATLSRLSDAVDKLWTRHISDCGKIRQMTRDGYSFFGYDDRSKYSSRFTTQQKDDLFNKTLKSENMRQSSAYRRLKLVMDYWCALWFWPITEAHLLPSRDEILMELTAILEGGVYEVAPANDAGQIYLLSEAAPPQQEINFTADEFGYVNVDELCKGFPRLALVKELADRYRFHHWELEFADLFADRGGFDLILGNPPWVKVEWNEGGILGDRQPMFVLRKISASLLAGLREETLTKYNLRQEYLAEYSEFAGVQNFLNGLQNYPLLKGSQSNLYKCFLPLSWFVGKITSVAGYVHPEGIYDDPKGGSLRGQIYQRLKYHFQFQNQLMLFEIGHREKYSLNVYSKSNKLSFFHISNLFHPTTIDQSFNHKGSSECLGIKDNDGKWNLNGHNNRVISIDANILSIFANLFDEPDTEFGEARLPSLHTSDLMNVLIKYANYKERLNNHLPAITSTEMWHETNSVKAGIISETTAFPDDIHNLIYSGPHFYVGNPLYKTPRSISKEKADYDVINFEYIGDVYLPRTKFKPASSVVNYLERVSALSWDATQKITSCFRIIASRRIGSAGERTLQAALIPPGFGHINTCYSIAVNSHTLLLRILAGFMSVPLDFFVKITGKEDFRGDLANQLPIINGKAVAPASIRVLMLNCLTAHYTSFWNECWFDTFHFERWAKTDCRLDNSKFSKLSASWNRDCPLRTDYERRQALVEIDVLVAMELGLTINELCTIYRIQFPVLRQNENDTWYDQNGRIVFTCSKGLPGVGFSRPEWNDIKDMKSGTVSRTIIDDTMPGGPVERTITYLAPFDKCDREEDYRTVWAEFERRFANVSEETA